MAHYRKVDTRIWNDKKFHALSLNGKLIFFYLLTHPHLTSLGAMRATDAGMASELGISMNKFKIAFSELLEKSMVIYDNRTNLIWLPNFLKYNIPESPNVIKSWATALEHLPEGILTEENEDSSTGYKCEFCGSENSDYEPVECEFCGVVWPSFEMQSEENWYGDAWLLKYVLIAAQSFIVNNYS